MKDSFNLVHETTKTRQILASLSAAGGAFAVGAALGWPSSAKEHLVPNNPRYFPISDSDFSQIASIITVGAMISCLPIGMLMKKFGRKMTMMGLVIPFVIGWSLVIFAKNLEMMLVGRFIIGLAGGAFCVSAPQYSSEIAENEVRGLVGTFFQLLIIAGILFSYIIGAYIDIYESSLICGAIPIVFAVIFSFMPESPVYLIEQGRDNEAILSYKWLRGDKYDPQNEINILKTEMSENETNQVSTSEVFSRKATKKAIAIGVGLMMFQQLSGINVVVFYISDIFQVRF
jgi:MFS family permease